MRFLVYGGLFLGACAMLLTLSSLLLTPKTVGPAIAPLPKEHPAPVVQVYGANVWGIRGRFAIHTWVAIKGWYAPSYTIYQVIGWRLRRHGTALAVTTGMPNVPWFRSPPLLLHEVKGSAGEALIEQIEQAIARYPYASEYTMWPGPNSNSFTEWIALSVPELKLDLPAKAIGAGWMRENFSKQN